ILLGVVLAVVSFSANAGIFSYSFGGTVTSAGGIFSGGVGDGFSGSFSYDDSAASTGAGVFGGTAYPAISFVIDV
ncbi:MAG: hypothetical protein V3V64_03740, partial [Acidiferrobacterales bacterium]